MIPASEKFIICRCTALSMARSRHTESLDHVAVLLPLTVFSEHITYFTTDFKASTASPTDFLSRLPSACLTSMLNSVLFLEAFCPRKKNSNTYRYDSMIVV